MWLYAFRPIVSFYLFSWCLLGLCFKSPLLDPFICAFLCQTSFFSHWVWVKPIFLSSSTTWAFFGVGLNLFLSRLGGIFLLGKKHKIFWFTVHGSFAQSVFFFDLVLFAWFLDFLIVCWRIYGQMWSCEPIGA